MQKNVKRGDWGEEIVVNLKEEVYLTKSWHIFSWKYRVGYLNTFSKKPEQQHWCSSWWQGMAALTKMDWEGVGEISVGSAK